MADITDSFGTAANAVTGAQGPMNVLEIGAPAGTKASSVATFSPSESYLKTSTTASVRSSFGIVGGDLANGRYRY